MVKITNRDEFAGFLAGKSDVFVRILGIRLALRVFPFCLPPKQGLDLVLPLFRTLFIARSAALWPTNDLVKAARAAAIATDEAASGRAVTPVARTVARTAAYTIDMIYDVREGTSSIGGHTFYQTAAFAASTYAAQAAGDVGGQHCYSAFWSEIQDDAAALEHAVRSNSKFEYNLKAPLWSGHKPYPIAKDAWEALRAILSNRAGDCWAPWIEWYDRILSGENTNFSGLSVENDKMFCLQLATETEAFWNCDVNIVNNEIDNRFRSLRSSSVFENFGGGYADDGKLKKSRSGSKLAQTEIGKSIFENYAIISEKAMAVALLIDYRIVDLMRPGPNEPEELDRRQIEIRELSELRSAIMAIKIQSTKFLSEKASEQEVVSVVKAFQKMLVKYMENHGADALQMSVKTALISIAAIIGCLCGVGWITTASVSAIAGGKVVVDAIKAAKPLKGRGASK